ncbi:DUF4065 domain-containing protein [Streptococcus thermophilus]|uniref:Panacea domain-containing protein n=1 Tax=Streptococcus thermophilus TaxID=1308 RepID=UPI0022FDE6D5|nr:type II toxin-antitoxin system antitoxin SocA domain-containing protein [Streptococcus thermophilus]MDA5520427.1 DUF4065 domain-containing protein [Streptococcus thermophilus]MDW2957690.1 DUF4065 domain-containing protein [Streptococcus thermophilus]
MTMRELADHIISVANEKGKSITNLQLQKILYFALRNSVSRIGKDVAKRTYNEPFLVWRYGPVVKSEYERFYTYGASPIVEDFQQSETYKPLNDLIDGLLDIDVFEMVHASHTHRFWKDNEDRICGGRSDIEYPFEEVIRSNGE